MDVQKMSCMKELKEENRRLKKMNIEEKHKAEIVAEVLEKKLSGHLAERRWPRCTITAGVLHQVTPQLAAYNTR